MYKDKDKQREAIAICRHCGHRLELVPGKVQRQFCSDAHRKAYKRAELVKSEATGGPTVDEPRTVGTNQPRTSTPDITGSIDIETLAKVDEACGDKLSHGLKRGKDIKYPKGVTNLGCDKEGVTDIERDKAIEFMAKTASEAERAESKRGKDIKCFADLPLDVQNTIESMSVNDEGVIDQTIKANRTAIAVHYQHLFPDRYYSTGVA